MRLKLHSSLWPAEARWGSGVARWALEIGQAKDERLLDWTVYDDKKLPDGQRQQVAVVAHVSVEEGRDAFEEAANAVLDALDAGFGQINGRDQFARRGYLYDYAGGAVDEEGYQAEFVEQLKKEFAIEPEAPKPLTPEQIAFQERAAARQRALQANLIELFGKPEEPSI